MSKFLIPNLNNDKIDDFYTWYANATSLCKAVDLDRYDKRPSVVAHSFGSWFLCKAMLKYEDIRFDKVILVGSILPADFDWSTLFARDQVALVLNECGHKDPWPKWASHFVVGTGTGGSEGFDFYSSALENKHLDWFSHSDALRRAHMEKHWLPFLKRIPSPLGLRHGRSIDNGPEFADMLDYSGDVLDNAVFGHLPNYRAVEIPRGLSLEWIRINPDIYTFMVDRDSGGVAGYINAMPVEDGCYEKIRSGKLADNEIKARDIIPYDGSQRDVKVYLMSIAIDEQYRQWGEGLYQRGYFQLSAGLVDKFAYYAKKCRIRVTHLLATAWTEEGEKICEKFKMSKVGKDSFGDPIYEIDLEFLASHPSSKSVPSILKELLRVYKSMPL